MNGRTVLRFLAGAIAGVLTFGVAGMTAPDPTGITTFSP